MKTLLIGLILFACTSPEPKPKPKPKPIKQVGVNSVDHITANPSKVTLKVDDSVRVVTRLWRKNGQEVKVRNVPLWYSCTPKPCGIIINPIQSETDNLATIIATAAGEHILIIQTVTKKIDSVLVTVTP